MGDFIARACYAENIETELDKRYRVLVIDPPWNQGKTGKRKCRPNQTTTLDYPTMGKSELMELPVNQWAEDQSFLWLWATNSKDRKTGEPILKTAFDLMEEWGPRLDVFARQVREGYDGWGNQYGSLTTEEKRPRTLRHAEDYENRLQA